MRRRELLAFAFGLVVAPLARAVADPARRSAPYAVDVGILYNTLTLRLAGMVDESVDRAAGRYAVTVAGEGAGIANRIESTGILRDGRWAPVRAASRFDVKGRESRSEVAYDYRRRTIQIHARSETFFLRRLRVLDDVVPLPEGQHVDDVISAVLNYSDGRWRPEADGSLRTRVVRRRRSDREGPDDVERAYRAELVPLVLRVATDPGTGKTTARFELSPFSSWARVGRPASVVFDAERRPELITSTMILGTSITVRFGAS